MSIIDEFPKEIPVEHWPLVVKFGCLHYQLTKSYVSEPVATKIEPPDVIKPVAFYPRLEATPIVAQGQEGESKVYDLLSSVYETSLTSKEGKSMDLKVKLDVGIVGIEVKNYTTTVSKIQIEKFIRDMDVSDYIAGIFVSLGSKIVNHKDYDRLYLEEASDGRPLIYVAIKNASSLVVLAIDIIQQLLRSKRKTLEHDSDLIRSADLTSDAASTMLKIKDDLQASVESFNRTFSKYGERILIQVEKLKASAEMQRKLSINKVEKGDIEEIWKQIKLTYNYRNKILKQLLEEVNKDGDEWSMKSEKVTHGNISILFKGDIAYFQVKNKYVSEEDMRSLLITHFKFMIKESGSEKIGIEINETTINFIISMCKTCLSR